MRHLQRTYQRVGAILSAVLLVGTMLYGVKLSIDKEIEGAEKAAYILASAQEAEAESFTEARKAAYSEPQPIAAPMVIEAMRMDYTAQAPAPTQAPEPAEEEEPEDEPAKLYYDVALPEETQDYIFEMEDKYGVPSEVIVAVIFKESCFNPDAVGGLGEQGYMQINPCNNEWLTKTLGVTDFFDPEQNIECGVYMLSIMLDKYGNVNKALMAYNCGEGGASKLWSKGITETDYSKAIAKIMSELTMKET